MARRLRRDADPNADFRRAVMLEIYRRNPSFKKAVLADASTLARHRGQRATYRSRPDALRKVGGLLARDKAFAAQVMVRLKIALLKHEIPVLPRLLHRLAMATAGVCVGNPVVLKAGVSFPHGQVVIDGLTEIGAGTVFMPYTSCGLVAGNFVGPTVGRNVTIGSGSTLLGPLKIGAGSTIRPKSAVTRDIPAGVTVGGVPARPITT